MKKKKIVYGILNWNRDISDTLDSISWADNIIACSNVASVTDITDKATDVQCEPNVAKSKNNIIKEAREQNADYLFILEDDVIVKDSSVFDKYIDIMKKYDLGFIFYGYNGNYNMLMRKKHNPSIRIKLNDEGEEAMFNRFTCTGVIGIDLKKNKELFDEDLNLVELDEYCQRCTDKGIIPFNGFYFDVPSSWKYFERADVPTERIKDMQIGMEDRKKMENKKISIKMEINIDKLINLLKEKEGM